MFEVEMVKNLINNIFNYNVETTENEIKLTSIN